MDPKDLVQLLGKMAQVEDVDGQQAEKHKRLRPLRGVAPKHARVLDDQRAHVRFEPKEPGDDPFSQPGAPALRWMNRRSAAEPFPTSEDRRATVDCRCGVIEEVS